MRNISDLTQAVPLFKCLGSETRVAILKLLSSEGPMQMSAIAENLGITAGSLSLHIKMLTECGLINIRFETGRHGLQRICSIADEKILIDLESAANSKNVYETEIGVGLYSEYEVYPTCGISTSDHLIGQADDPRFFSSPERISAGILWFTIGFVEYLIPNYLEDGQEPLELLISFEIASEAPGIREDWPSDIDFSINGIPVCMWTAPGDFGKNPGIYTPSWWDANWNQYGLLKFLSVNETGTFIDGVKVSDCTLSDLNITAGSNIKLRMSVSNTSVHKGGLTLYGRSFGNYPQDIKVRMQYKVNERPADPV
ncbi:MAG: ArsR family transcriptional regulator [Lachnospiraceae bacterium]|nr:ArsR family transcriptional regulator [Lachnospiraceae bacterium]